MPNRRFITAICLGVLLIGATALLACPSCKDAVPLGSGPGGDGVTPAGLPSGFNASVLTMLGGLMLVIGLMARVVFKGIRSSVGSAPIKPPTPALSRQPLGNP